MSGDSHANWSKVPHALIFDPTLSAQALRLGSMLLAFDALGRGCFPSEETLCYHFGSRAKMYRALAELRSRGYLTVTKIGRRNRYDLLFPYTPITLKAPADATRPVSKTRPNREDPILELRDEHVSNMRPSESAQIERVAEMRPIEEVHHVSEVRPVPTLDVSEVRPLGADCIADLRPRHVSYSRPNHVRDGSRKRDVERDTRLSKNNAIKNIDGDGINPTAVRALAIETRIAECGISDKEAAGLAKALVATDIPIGLIVEATWDVMRRPARLQQKVSNLVGYVLATVYRKAAKTPLELYRDELENYDPTGEIYLGTLDDSKRARILAYMEKAGLRQLPGPRMRDLDNYLDFTDRMMSSVPMTA